MEVQGEADERAVARRRFWERVIEAHGSQARASPSTVKQVIIRIRRAYKRDVS